MKPQEQLDWEARMGKFAAIAAFVSAVLVIGGNVLLQAGALSSRPDNERELLKAIHDNSGAFLLSSFIQASSYIAFAGVLYYLFRTVRARRPELPGFAGTLVILGPLLYAAARPITDLGQIDAADTFVQSGAQTIARAKDLLDDRDVLSVAVGSGGTLALAIGLVLLSINAMRVGLLTRFMGIIGAIIGALYVLPVLSGPLIIQLFWSVALGMLFLGRWPGGRGPAWETGQAEPWPGGTTIGGGRGEPEPPAEEPAPDPDTPPKRKRKRKKRR
jgi:Domain of unknown function (DUF4386)